jgi:hypothetical protein
LETFISGINSGEGKDRKRSSYQKIPYYTEPLGRSLNNRKSLNIKEKEKSNNRKIARSK